MFNCQSSVASTIKGWANIVCHAPIDKEIGDSPRRDLRCANTVHSYPGTSNERTSRLNNKPGYRLCFARSGKSQLHSRLESLCKLFYIRSLCIIYRINRPTTSRADLLRPPMHLITYLVSNYKEAQQRFFIGMSLAQHGTDICVQPQQVQLCMGQNLPQDSFVFTIARCK